MRREDIYRKRLGVATLLERKLFGPMSGIESSDPYDLSYMCQVYLLVLSDIENANNQAEAEHDRTQGQKGTANEAHV